MHAPPYPPEIICKLNSTESSYMQKSKQQLNQLVAVLLFWETLSLPDHSWSLRPKNMAIFSAHVNLIIHTQNESNSSTHCWDINNSYFSTLSTLTKMWQFTIKMVVTSKVALRKHLCKTAHIVQLGLERGFLYNFFICYKTAGSSKHISD